MQHGGEDLRNEAARSLGYIRTPAAQDALLAAASLLAPATLLEAGRAAGVEGLVARAHAALDDPDPVVRWRAVRFLASVALPHDDVLTSAVEREVDTTWREKMREALDEVPDHDPVPAWASNRDMVVNSPVFGSMPAVLSVWQPEPGPLTGRPRACWEVRTAYGPCRIRRRTLQSSMDGFSALLDALQEVHTFVLGSYEFRQGWVARPDSTPLGADDFEVAE